MGRFFWGLIGFGRRCARIYRSKQQQEAERNEPQLLTLVRRYLWRIPRGFILLASDWRSL